MKRKHLLFALIAVLLLTGCGTNEKAEISSASSLISGEIRDESHAVNSSQPPAASQKESVPVSSSAESFSVSDESSASADESASSSVSENAQEEASATFHGEAVTGLYSLDYKNRTYHSYPYPQTVSFLSDLEKLDTGASFQSGDMVGFLVFTDAGKYAFYLNPNTDDENERVLAEEASGNNASVNGKIQWIAYMSTSNITQIMYTGAKDAYSPTVDITVTDREDIERISRFLKSVSVEAGPVISPFSGNFADINLALNYSFSVSIRFSTGVEYLIVGYPGPEEARAEKCCLSIRSSDMKEAITYVCSEKPARELFRLMNR